MRSPSIQHDLVDLVVDGFKKVGVLKYRAAFEGLSEQELRDLLCQLEEHIEAGIRYDEPKPKEPSATDLASRSRPKGRAIKTGENYFLQVPLDAAVDERLSHADFRLLCLLVILSGQKGCCWHGSRSLARELVGTRAADGTGRKGVSYKTVERSLVNIQQAGYIDIIEPDELKARGYTHTTPSQTYVLRFEIKEGRVVWLN